MNEQELYELLGKVIAWGISSAGAAFLLVHFCGQKWIETKFSKDLEAFKVQKLHEFDLLLTRKTKWHEKEHEILSTAWIKIMQAYNSLRISIAAFRALPDLDRMDAQEFNSFLEKSDLSEEAKQYLLSEQSKTSAYSRILDNRSINEAHRLFFEFHNYFEENRIFLSPDVKEKFLAVDDHLWSAWVDKKMSHDDQKISFTLEARKTMKEKIEPLIQEIEMLIQKNLFPEETNHSN